MKSLASMIPLDRRDRGLWWSAAWSLVEGCSSVSAGCRNCWAAEMTHRRAKRQNEKIQARYGGLTKGTGAFSGRVRLQSDVMHKPEHTKHPQVWAVWNDLFHEAVPEAFQWDVFNVMRQCERHAFVVLTKRPMRARDFLLANRIQRMRNVFIGTSVEDNVTADDRLPTLGKIKAMGWRTVVSFEPLLSQLVRVQRHTGREKFPDWVIVGGETGSGARPMLETWVGTLLEVSRGLSRFFWFKGWGTGGRLRGREFYGRVYNETPSIPGEQ